MKKTLTFLFFIAALLILFLPKTVSATTFTSKIDDQAQLLQDSSSLDIQADSLANSIKASVFVVTTDTNQDDPATYAREYLTQQIGAGHNGVILLIDMGQRKVQLWGTGNMKEYLTSSRIEHALDKIQPPLHNGDYDGGITAYFEQMQAAVDAGIPGRKYSVNPETGQITFHHSFQPLSMLIAGIVAVIAAGGFAWQLQRRYQMKGSSARVYYDYRQNGQLNLTQQQDILVNTFITTRQIPRSTDSGGGSSGGSGGGRSF